MAQAPSALNAIALPSAVGPHAIAATNFALPLVDVKIRPPRHVVLPLLLAPSRLRGDRSRQGRCDGPLLPSSPSAASPHARTGSRPLEAAVLMLSLFATRLWSYLNRLSLDTSGGAVASAAKTSPCFWRARCASLSRFCCMERPFGVPLIMSSKVAWSCNTDSALANISFLTSSALGPVLSRLCHECSANQFTTASIARKSSRSCGFTAVRKSI